MANNSDESARMSIDDCKRSIDRLLQTHAYLEKRGMMPASMQFIEQKIRNARERLKREYGIVH